MTEINSPPKSADEIRQWIIRQVSERAQIGVSEVRPDEPVVAHGIDSMQFVVLIGELEDWLGCRFTDNPLIRYPTINALAEFLARQLQQGKSVINPSAEEISTS